MSHIHHNLLSITVVKKINEINVDLNYRLYDQIIFLRFYIED